MIASVDTTSTCVVGLIANGHVHITADSAGVSGLDVTRRRDPKVFRHEAGAVHLVFGCTTSFRMIQLLRFSLSVPTPKLGQDVCAWMCTDVIDAIRTMLKSGGFARVDDNRERGGAFLVGVKRVAERPRLFVIQSESQVGELEQPYAALGCGHSYALGALHATADLGAPHESAPDCSQRRRSVQRGHLPAVSNTLDAHSRRTTTRLASTLPCLFATTPAPYTRQRPSAKFSSSSPAMARAAWRSTPTKRSFSLSVSIVNSR